MGAYDSGSDILGGDGLAVVIRLKDVAKVMREKGGATGQLAFGLVPQTAEKAAYGQIRDKIAAGLHDEGVDADVRVVSGEGYGSSPQDLLLGAGLGAGALGLMLLAARMLKRRR